MGLMRDPWFIKAVYVNLPIPSSARMIIRDIVLVTNPAPIDNMLEATSPQMNASSARGMLSM